MIPAAPSAAPATTPVPAAGTEVAAGDFLLMLGQLLGAPVAASTSKPSAVAAADEGDLETATKDAAEITGVPVPAVAVPLIQSAQAEAGAPVDVVTPLQTGGDGAGNAKVNAALSKALPEALMQADSGSPEVAVAPPATADISHQLRASASHDPGPQRPLHQPVGTSAWADELGTRMVLMSERGQQSASLRLNPENLGPLEVRISVRDDQASVWFGSAHSDTRAAIEQALPRLRELFESQGLSLTDAGVHHDAPRDRSGTPSQTSNGSSLASENDVTPAQAIVRLGLVDEYV